MTERPILFSGPLVRAILDGRKTVTRRIVRGVPERFVFGDVAAITNGTDWNISRFDPPRSEVWPAGDATLRKPAAVGDTLLVRETARVLDLDADARLMRLRYEADGYEASVPWPARIKAPKVGICLPNGAYLEACRLRLKVTGVRVERLQQMDPNDVADEGFRPSRLDKPIDGPLTWKSAYGYWHNDDYDAFCEHEERQALAAFAALWDSLAPEGSRWADNPWVWVVEFKRTEAT